jgi:hypothetical protein
VPLPLAVTLPRIALPPPSLVAAPLLIVVLALALPRIALLLACLVVALLLSVVLVLVALMMVARPHRARGVAPARHLTVPLVFLVVVVLPLSPTLKGQALALALFPPL